MEVGQQILYRASQNKLCIAYSMYLCSCYGSVEIPQKKAKVSLKYNSLGLFKYNSTRYYSRYEYEFYTSRAYNKSLVFSKKNSQFGVFNHQAPKIFYLLEILGQQVAPYSSCSLRSQCVGTDRNERTD